MNASCPSGFRKKFPLNWIMIKAADVRRTSSAMVLTFLFVKLTFHCARAECFFSLKNGSFWEEIKVLRQKMTPLCGQCHGYWCPGSLGWKDIISQGRSLSSVKISNNYVISMWNKIEIYIHIFIFIPDNSVCTGVSHFRTDSKTCSITSIYTRRIKSIHT